MIIKNQKKNYFFVIMRHFFVSHRLNLYKLFDNNENIEPILIVGRDASIINATIIKNFIRK